MVPEVYISSAGESAVIVWLGVSSAPSGVARRHRARRTTLGRVDVDHFVPATGSSLDIMRADRLELKLRTYSRDVTTSLHSECSITYASCDALREQVERRAHVSRRPSCR